MTLKRLMIILAVLVFLAGIGIMWLWQYAYSPEGRARIIIAQLRGEDDKTFRGWMLKHHVVRQGFSVPLRGIDSEDAIPKWFYEYTDNASDEMVKLGHEVLPIVIESLHDDNVGVRRMAIRACGKFRDPSAIPALRKLSSDN